MNNTHENVVGKWFMLTFAGAKSFVENNPINDFVVRSMFNNGFLDAAHNVYVFRVTKQIGKSVTEIEGVDGRRLEVLILLTELNRFFASYLSTHDAVKIGIYAGDEKMFTRELVTGALKLSTPEKFVKQDQKKREQEPNLDDFTIALKEYFRMGVGVISSDTQRFGNFESFERHIKETVRAKRKEIAAQIEELQKKLG